MRLVPLMALASSVSDDGRGLKLEVVGLPLPPCLASSVSDDGRGLKRVQVEAQSQTLIASSVSDDGRGLKHSFFHAFAA